MEKLNTLKVSQLKRLCLLTGSPSSGTKASIIQSLTANLMNLPFESRNPISSRSFNIISIDMGIRNFAYVRLQLDKTLPFNKPPVVKEWVKFDVTHWNDQIVNQNKLESQLSQVNQYFAESSFDPKYFSELTYRLVDKVIFNQEYDTPDIILIERQRARSMGSSSILEWVFKVNMFEAMLFSLIYSKSKSLEERIDILSTSPKRMSEFWRPPDLVEKSDRKLKRITNKDSKEQRLQLVDYWLKGMLANSLKIPKFIISPLLFDLNSLNHSKPRSKTKWINQVVLSQNKLIKDVYGQDSETKKNIKDKGDDLVDCLLHALSWLEWEKNKMFLNLELKHQGLEGALKFSDHLYHDHKKTFEFMEKRD